MTNRTIWIAGWTLLLLHPALLGAASPIPPGFFGDDQNNTRSPWPPTTGAGTVAPIGSLRLWDDGVKWSNIESCNPQNSAGFAPTDQGNPCYGWSALDNWVTRAHAVGMDVLYTFGGTPGFSTSQTTPKTACETAGIYSCLPPLDVDNKPGSGLGDGTDATWIDFVTALVTRYKGTIQFYELWNEPDSPNFFTGTTAQFARMMNDAAATIRSIDPAAQILSPSFHGPTAATWFNTYLANGGAANFDIVNFHGRGSGTSNIEAEAILTTYAAAEPVIVAHGLQNRPFWDDEAGWLQDQVLDPDLQAVYVARLYILHASLGFGRFYWYQWDAPSPYQLQGTIASTAYAQVARWLVGSTISACAKNGLVYSCPVTLASGAAATIIWDASATCASGVCATTPTAVAAQYLQYLDIAGNTATIQNNTVPVGAKPILLQAAGGVAPSLAIDNAASYSKALAPSSIAVAFGSALAVASGAPTTISVQDSAGAARAASIFYASPQQAAFLIPAGTATGPATVSITSGDGTVSTATVQITAVAPGLFSANANGQGVAAADSVQGGNSSPVFSCGSAPLSCAAVPIPVNQTVLELYGTGIRGHSATGVTCTIGGVSVPVQYAGAQGSPGLDQVNIPIPPMLANRGQFNIVLTVDGQASNAVTIVAGPAN